MRSFPVVNDPNVVLGADAADDAAVYRISDEKALVFTTDFFTPIVDDPYDFGRIAAANALSDVYAVGGTPFAALNLVGFPKDDLPIEILAEILRGGREKAEEAGVVILGGHTVDDPEPKYGLSVTGSIHPDRVITNAGASPGDLIVLTKPLGTGIIGTAIKRGSARPEHIDSAVDCMAALNRDAAEAMVEVGVNACTDITGYGLLGHLLNIADASGVTIEIDFGAVPFLPGVWDYIDRGIVPGGTERNLESLLGSVQWPQTFGEAKKVGLADAQTSGGLAIVVTGKKLPELRSALKSRNVNVQAEIGRIVPRGDLPLVVLDQ